MQQIEQRKNKIKSKLFSFCLELNFKWIYLIGQVSGSLLGLLLLGLVVVQAQDDAAAGGDGAAPAAGDDGGAGGEDGPDEAWEYVEFLKDEVK